MNKADVLVVGGGPAGLAAALEARRSGAQVTLVDEYQELGGQFYRQPLHGRRRGHAMEGARLIARVGASGIDVRVGSLVWGLSDEREVELLSGGRRERLAAEAIVLATGAIERVIPFPGWTLPGVFSPGGAQTLVRWQNVTPGSRVIVAGSGPFLLPVASELAAAGVRVLGVFEAADLASLARGAARVGKHWGRLREALGYAIALRRSGVPVHFGRRLVAVDGAGKVERAVVARVDAEWRSLSGTERTIEVDAVCAGDGFVPATQLGSLFGCASAFRADDGGWHLRHDEHQETSVRGVFVAGEVGGIAGAHAALASGRIAGVSAARRSRGEAPSPLDAAGVRAALVRHREFAAVVNALYRIPRGAYAAIPDEVVICRCEDVTAAELRRASHVWSGEANVVKGVTRAGMGRCQGRTCAPTVAAVVALAARSTEELVGTFRVRAPLKPVRLGMLLEEPSTK